MRRRLQNYVINFNDIEGRRVTKNVSLPTFQLPRASLSNQRHSHFFFHERGHELQTCRDKLSRRVVLPHCDSPQCEYYKEILLMSDFFESKII